MPRSWRGACPLRSSWRGPTKRFNVRVRDALNNGLFRVYTNPDAVGVELAGALKNILGIAAGICDGLGFGDNAKASLLTRGLVEITRFGVDLGAQPRDLLRAGRRRRRRDDLLQPARPQPCGGRADRPGREPAEVLAGMVNVAEGVPTTRSVHDQALQRGIEMPITDELYQILFEGSRPGTPSAT